MIVVKLFQPNMYQKKIFNQPFPASFFFIFVFSIQLTVICSIKFCRWLDSNCGTLGSEATALPTEPQPLPNFWSLNKDCKVFIKISTGQYFQMRLSGRFHLAPRVQRVRRCQRVQRGLLVVFCQQSVWQRQMPKYIWIIHLSLSSRILLRSAPTNLYPICRRMFRSSLCFWMQSGI